MNHATIRRISIRYWSDVNESETLKGVQWNAECKRCGWSGPMRRTHIDAVHDREEHRCEDSPPNDAA